MWGRKKTQRQRIQFNITILKPDSVFEAIGAVGIQVQDNPCITAEAFRDFQDDVMENGLSILPAWGVYIV